MFELTPNSDGSWTEQVLYTFCSRTNCADGGTAFAGLIFDAEGNLYGTTASGGDLNRCNGGGCGVVFQLTPNANGTWKENVLHTFAGRDGWAPTDGLIFDQAGNLYGTTDYGGNLNHCTSYGCGVVFRLTPNADGSWKESVLHKFTGGKDGAVPVAGLIFDGAGSLYGTTPAGGAYGHGDVFKLAPNPDGSWTEKVLHQVPAQSRQQSPVAGVIFDASGNLYGTTHGGTNGQGVIFEIVP